MINWTTYKLSDIMDIIGGGTPKTTVPQFWNGSIPWLSVVDFGNDNKFVETTEKTITETGLHNSSTKILKKGQIIISARGTVGELAVLKRDMAFNQSCYGLNAKQDLCTNEYLYYLLKCKIAELKRNAHGAVFDTITRTSFDTILANIPDLPTQTAIAQILSSLDDKVELNNKINQELEALAQALFKQWFVDFEFPDENGKSYKSSGGEMVESPLGEIPKGWKISSIDDVTELVTKGTTPTTIGGRFTESGINFIKVESLTETGTFIKSKFAYIDDETNSMLKRSIINEGDVLFSIAGTIGRVAVATKSILPANTNQAIAIIRPNKIESYFLKILMQSSLIQNDTKANVVQAVQANLSLGVIKSTNFVLPSEKLLSIFKSATSHLLEQIEVLTAEIEELQNLRDTLLPKLISGELEVAENLIEQTVI
ncbi:MAG: restriction endonuclease subunit S [Saprospiraceae bacterium]